MDAVSMRSCDEYGRWPVCRLEPEVLWTYRKLFALSKRDATPLPEGHESSDEARPQSHRPRP